VTAADRRSRARRWGAVTLAAVVTMALPMMANAGGRKGSGKTGSTPPSITITTPAGGAILKGTVTVAGTARDKEGLDRVDVAVDNGSFAPATGTSSWSFQLDTSTYASASHLIRARVRDTSGNLRTASVTVAFDNVPPPVVDPSASPSPSPSPVPAPVPGPSDPPCSGVAMSPNDDLQSRIQSNPAGTTFCLQAGTYDVSTGVLVKEDDRIIGEPGTVLDGLGVASKGVWGYGTAVGQNNVTVRGLTLENFTGQAIKAGWNWTISNNEVRNSEVGVAVNDGTVLLGNDIHHNTRYGIIGGPTSNVLIENNEIAYNDTSEFCRGACEEDAGGSKIIGSTAGTSGVVWRGNWVHDNIGNGIWSDGNVHDVLYEDNLVEGNTGHGIFHEISWEATIRNNVVRNNADGSAGRSCYWGSQIDLNDSRNVDIYGNTVSSAAGSNGICLVDSARSVTNSSPASLANIDVHNNTVRLSGSAMTGLVGDAANDVTFDSNTYVVPDTSGRFWAWAGAYPLTWSEFRARAGEANGTVRTP
jgi:parallel beta-helix repeat protein